MAAGVKIQHKRRAGPILAGELAAGEIGLDISAGMWYFSLNGTTVQTWPAGAQMLSALTDVVISSTANDNLLTYDSATGKWTNQTPGQAGLVAVADRGAANGVATLGADSKIPASQLPALAITSTSVVASQAAQLALGAQEGDVAVRTDLGVSYIHNGGATGTMTDWSELRANDTTVDATHITGGDIAAARMLANVAAALNSSAAFTISNPNLILDGGTL